MHAHSREVRALFGRARCTPMHAWRGHAFGPPESLRWEEIDDAPLGDGQVRIDVKASAVNFPDVLFTAGTYQNKPTPPFVPGCEVAGRFL